MGSRQPPSSGQKGCRADCGMRQPQGNDTSAVMPLGQGRVAAQPLASQEAVASDLHGCSAWTATWGSCWGCQTQTHDCDGRGAALAWAGDVVAHLSLVASSLAQPLQVLRGNG